MLPETGKTSAEAAAGLGCSVAQIAKSILFRRRDDDAPVLVIASGANRVDEKKVAAQVGDIGRADAKFVREKTGYAIGGVCPIGHATEPVTLIDADLLALDSLWAAAGSSACGVQSDAAGTDRADGRAGRRRRAARDGVSDDDARPKRRRPRRAVAVHRRLQDGCRRPAGATDACAPSTKSPAGRCSTTHAKRAVLGRDRGRHAESSRASAKVRR